METNPKTALFFLAFLPQFVDPSRGEPAPQILALGAIVTLSAIPCDLLVAWTADVVAEHLRSHPRFTRIQAWVPSSILVALGLYVAFAEREA